MIEILPRMQSSRRLACVVFALAAGCAMIALRRGRREAPELSHSSEEDAFVSYYQAAYGLASGLVEIKSREEFERQNQEGAIDRLAEQLAAFREAVEQLSETERADFDRRHSDLLEQTRDACQKLQRFHDRNPEILGNQWEAYWNALPFPD